MDDLVIREGRPDEFEAVSELLVAAYGEYAPRDGSAAEEREAWRAYSVELADVRGRASDGSQLVVAEEDGRLTGRVTFYPPGSDGAAESGWPRKWAGIRLLGVHPDRRGRGIARRLTEDCLRRARTAGAATVGLHTANVMTAAQGLYTRMGFRRISDGDQEMAPGLVIMAFRLDL